MKKAYTYKITALIGYSGVDLDEEYAVYAYTVAEARKKAEAHVKKLFPKADFISLKWTHGRSSK